MSEEATLDEFVGQNDPDSSGQKVSNENWRSEKLKNHTELISGVHIKSDKVHSDDTSTPYLTGPEDFEGLGFKVTKYTNEPTKFCEPGDTLITVKGSGCGKSAFSDRRACISRQLKALRPNSSINPLYLYYSTKVKKKFLETLSEGSAIPGLSNSHLTTLNIPVPPLEEQRKIATVLHNVDQAIQKTEKIIEQTERVKMGVIQENILDEISKPSSPTALGKVPNNWDKVKLESAASKQEGSLVDGPFGSSLKAEEFVEDGYARILQLQNVKEGWYCDSNIRYVNEKIYKELGRHSAEPGDLFIAKMASPVARTCILPVKYDHYMLGCADVVKLTPNGEFIDEFVMYCLNSYPIWKQAAAHIRGSGRLRVNLNQLKEIELPKPPRDEQEKIVTAVEGITDFIDSHKDEKQQLQRLKKALMQDLLSGKVRTTDTSITIPDEIQRYG